MAQTGFVALLMMALLHTCYGSEETVSESTSFNIKTASGLFMVHLTPSLLEQIVTGDESSISYNCTFIKTNDTQTVLDSKASENVELIIKAEDSDVISVLSNETLLLGADSYGNITVKGEFLGRTFLRFSTRPATHSQQEQETNASWVELDLRYPVSVVRPTRVIDTIFIVVVAIVVLVPKIGMGCKLDMDIVFNTLKKPFAPIIGFICQFIIMPGVAYGIIEMLGMKGGLALGFFAAGCAPGGGASNFYAYLLKGDISLSVTMSFISTVASLGMIPLWMFTVGRILMKRSGAHIQVPFLNICITLISIVVPLGIGVLLQYKAPECSKKFGRILRPIMLLFLIFLMTFGVYVNLYVFKLYTWRLVLAGCLLPYLGFLIGAVVAAVCKQPMDRVKTIAIETGVQNLGIAILLMKLSLPQPDADISLLSPIVVGTFGPLPLLVAVLVIEIRKRCCKKKEEDFKEVKQDELENNQKEDETDLNRSVDENSKAINA